MSYETNKILLPHFACRLRCLMARIQIEKFIAYRNLTILTNIPNIFFYFYLMTILTHGFRKIRKRLRKTNAF